jgi:protein phosphatase
VSALSDPGCVRENNEDRARVVRPADPRVAGEKGVLVLVADGMGGHSAGEVASEICCAAVHRAYYDGAAATAPALRDALLDANRRILDAASRDPRLHGMGTTCTALVLRGWQAFWAHVGDSRLYLARGGGLYQMTEDHSVVARLVADGQLRRAEARHHADRNVILRALGTHAEVEVDVSGQPLDLQPGDRLLLSTDGLTDPVGESELLEALQSGPAAEACRRLVARARARGAPDNVTVVVVEVHAGEGPALEAPPETAAWRAAGPAPGPRAAR